MEEAFYNFFVNLIGKPTHRAHTIDLHSINIPSTNLFLLDTDFSEVEVWEAIKSLPSVKALSPDGYICLFYQKCWVLIKQDVMGTINKLGRLDGHNFRLLNQASLTLVSKRPGAQEAKDHQPISLLHSLVKLFSKIVAQRMAPELGSAVADNHMAFINGRSIQDNFLLVRQSARLLNKKKDAQLPVQA